MSKNHQIWVVVADSCRAKIYRSMRLPKIEEIADLAHPESGFHNQDLVSSKPGHSTKRGGVNGVSYQPEHEPKQLEADKFARYLGDYLSTAQQKGDYDRLYIIAAPTFLGLLRQHISPEVQKMIISEEAKDLASFSHAAIEKHLSNVT